MASTTAGPTAPARRLRARGYEGRFDCKQTEAPARLWPAHAAPLQMLAVPAGAASAFAGQLVVAWHGYRAGGHRIVGHALDAKGRPQGAPRSGSTAGRRRKGFVRSARRPASRSIRRGALLIVEDRHKTLLMLARETP